MLLVRDWVVVVGSQGVTNNLSNQGVSKDKDLDKERSESGRKRMYSDSHVLREWSPLTDTTAFPSSSPSCFQGFIFSLFAVALVILFIIFSEYSWSFYSP